jgi:RNA polymerase sigma-70 factor (ECF subfamily)
MVGAMAKAVSQTDNDDLVFRARTDAEALGRLYELYYEKILRFCVHRLFSREVAEDVTSTIFLAVARSIGRFEGVTEYEFRNWLYAIAINQVNAYIRKTSRRRRLLSAAAAARSAGGGRPTEEPEPDWPSVYEAILSLKPEHQTILTLRFFEKLAFADIAEILGAREGSVRVTLHRILEQLRKSLKIVGDGE